MAVKKPTVAKPAAKAAAKKPVAKKESSSWIGEIEKYSRQIWLAGLGAYSKISIDGNKLFDGLVKDGEKAEKKAKTEVDKQLGVVKSSVGSTVGSAKSKVDKVKGKAMGKWNELEEAFDKRLNSAISRLGVPCRNEVKELQVKVDSLTKQIEKLTGVSVKSAAKPATKTAPNPAVKAAAQPAAKAPVNPAAKKTVVNTPVAPAAVTIAPAATPSASGFALDNKTPGLPGVLHWGACPCYSR